VTEDCPKTPPQKKARRTLKWTFPCPSCSFPWPNVGTIMARICHNIIRNSIVVTGQRSESLEHSARVQEPRRGRNTGIGNIFFRPSRAPYYAISYQGFAGARSWLLSPRPFRGSIWQWAVSPDFWENNSPLLPGPLRGSLPQSLSDADFCRMFAEFAHATHAAFGTATHAPSL
jgi:hypothetical protein